MSMLQSSTDGRVLHRMWRGLRPEPMNCKNYQCSRCDCFVSRYRGRPREKAARLAGFCKHCYSIVED